MQRVRVTFISPKRLWSNLTLVLGLVCVGLKARLFGSAACQGQCRVSGSGSCQDSCCKIRGIRYELCFECNQAFGSNVNVSGVMIKYKS